MSVLLHISDTHFGTEQAPLKRRGRAREYDGVVPRLSRMLETGELPDGEDELEDGAIGPEDLGRFVVTQTCEACGGVRLRPEALSVRIGGKNIGEVCRLPLRTLKLFLQEYAQSSELLGRDATIALPLVRAAQAEGVPITAETCLHYLAFTAEEVAEGATQFKCAPPIRESGNRERLWQGIEDGAIGMWSRITRRVHRR